MRCRLSTFLLMIVLAGTGGLVPASRGADRPAGPARKTGLIPRKVLFGNPDRAGPQLSPDGKQLAFLAPLDGVLNVWVGPADDPKAARPVTRDRKRAIQTYF